MAGNPLSAFLQGFAVVDKLETNREIRADNKQQRSRLNTLWERQDQEFERQELDRYRQKKLVEFDATVKDIVNTMDPDDPGFLEADSSNGKITGFNRVANEAVRRMIQIDPEFGEHIAKVFGLDPASGPLVRDSTKPVSGVGLIPGSLAPGNSGGGAVIEIDSVNGFQPMTDNRTSADNDPITMNQIGLRELVGIFGEGVNKNDLLISMQLKNALNLNEVTGQSFQSQTQGAPTQAPTTQAPTTQQAPTTAATQEAGGTALDRSVDQVAGEQRAEALRRVEASGLTEEEYVRQQTGQAGGDRATPDQVTTDEGTVGTNEQPADSDIVAFTGQENADQLANVIANSKGHKALVERERRAKQTFGDRLSEIKANIQRTIDIAKETDANRKPTESGSLVQGVVDSVNGFFGNAEADPQKISDSINKPPTEAAATSLNDIDGDSRDFAASKVRTEQGAANALATVPTASPKGVQSISRSLSNRRARRPNTIELYNVLSLQRATGLFSSEQIMNFARTGKFDAPAQRKLKFFEVDGVVSSFDDATGQLVSQTRVGGGAGSGLPDIKDQQALLNLLQDSTKGLFEDNPRGQQQFLDAAEGTYTILGLPGTSEDGLKARATPDVMNSIVRGAQYVKNFDEDSTQNLFQGTGDFNPLPGSDLKLPMTPGNLALGYAANESGITSQGAADEFLTQYGGELQSYFNFNGREMYLNAIDKEATVMARVAAGRNPKHDDYEKYKGMSRAKIRREYVEELISSDAGQ